ncbi:MAG TPA: cupin domain-containing protein [Candidatus Methylomirabilis sp.]|nr:cupin domain-containing protein [Candidatus Methylomirabilis sp.]
MDLDEKALAKQLEREGFGHTFVWQDGPNTYYSEHTHETETAHIILNGEMNLTMDGRSKTYRVGERCDVPAGAVHSAKMGPQGCRYLIGEK